MIVLVSKMSTPNSWPHRFRGHWYNYIFFSELSLSLCTRVWERERERERDPVACNHKSCDVIRRITHMWLYIANSVIDICEDWVPILHICDNLVPIFTYVSIWYQFFTTVSFWYQFFTCVKSAYQFFTYVKLRTNSSHVWNYVPILHICENCVPILHICEELLAILHICEELLAFLHIY